MQHHVLVVDDEENMRHMLSTFLSQNAYRANAVRNGAEALEELRKDQYDIVLCDIRMPEMDGMTFLNRMAKENLSGPTVIENIPQPIVRVPNGTHCLTHRPRCPQPISPPLRKMPHSVRAHSTVFLSPIHGPITTPDPAWKVPGPVQAIGRTGLGGTLERSRPSGSGEYGNAKFTDFA